LGPKQHILAVDIGTTAMKLGVFELSESRLVEKATNTQSYEISTYNNGLFSDIDPEKWKRAFVKGCSALSTYIPKIETISLSGTTPGLTAMDKNGNALCPSILMLDQRSRKEAEFIIETLGLEEVMKKTGNMPVAGGCSLASILWIKNNLPDKFKKTACFGHSNTFFAKWLTGNFAIDPSSASLSALYNTVENKLEWNRTFAETFGIGLSQLPTLAASWDSVGLVKGPISKTLGFTKNPKVIIGGNDAVLAAYSAGINNPGAVINVNGTCEISLVCLPECIYSTNYNVRAHVFPNHWLTLHVMNAGGKAYEWFHSLFCSTLAKKEFFDQFLPKAISTWLDQKSSVSYGPFLMGSRYSQKALKAEFRGLTLNSSIDEMAAAVTRSLCGYQRKHLLDINRNIPLDKTIFVTGGAVNEALIQAKKRWMWPGEYQYVKQSSLMGAALLAKEHLGGNNRPTTS
jgi:xylulokinase